MDEFDLIKRYFAPLAEGYSGSLNLTDDAALIDVPDGQQLVVTKDAMSQGVHFIGSEDAALIAQKLLRTNLSDLASMGARPEAYLLAIMLPKDIKEAWIVRFAEGLIQDQKEFSIALAGGDTVATGGTLSLSITALGTVERGKALRRSGAKAGDFIYVSGTLGDSAFGLASLQKKLPATVSAENAKWLENRYLLPQPRIALGQKLRGIATSCIDISDGLVQDLGHICTQSRLHGVIDGERLPVSNAAHEVIDKAPDWGMQVLSGGDDYELLFTVPPDKASLVPRDCDRIGIMEAGSGVTVLDEKAQPMMLEKTGFKHF